MNILLTTSCNRKCPYCFAAERVGLAGDETGEASSGVPSLMSLESFDRVLSFAVRSGERSISLLGGEPSLHPELPAIIESALEHDRRRLRVKVFTNGMWPGEHIDALRERLSDRARRRLAIIVNLNHPELATAKETRAQSELFESLGSFCSLSCNVFRQDQELGYLIEAIERHRLKPHIRLAIAQPLAGSASECVPLAEYPTLAGPIMRLVETCDVHDVTIGFDCGFTLCMFTAEQLGRLVQANCHPRATCEPCLDVGTDLSVWACFPLSTRAEPVRLEDFADTTSLRAHFRERHFEHYSLGAMEECGACRFFRRGQCPGGCAAHCL